MNSLRSMVGTPIGYVIYFAAYLILSVLLLLLLQLVNGRHCRIRTVAAGLHFLLAFAFFTVLLDYAYNIMNVGHAQALSSVELLILEMPWLLAACLEILSAALIWRHGRYLKRYRDMHLTEDAIRQTVDRLPMGLLVSEPDGTVLLANPLMMKLCRSLTGELLSNANRFRQLMKEKASDLLVHTENGTSWKFETGEMILGGQRYDQLTAVDVTELFRINAELSEKNRRLKAVQEQMKEVAEKEKSLVVEREIMNARMTVHNRMGAVLLSGKYYLDHPENVIEEELLRLLEFSNRSLLGEAEQSESNMNQMQEAIQAAEKIGVYVKTIGNVPQNEEMLRLIAQGIDQCASNTARHAGGDQLSIRIMEIEAGIIAIFSNNGQPPKAPVVPTGGLAGLRKTVEAAGGSMEIRSEPVFELKMLIPKSR